MRRKLFQIFKWVILGVVILIIIALSVDLYNSFIEQEEYEDFISFMQKSKEEWIYSSLGNYKINLIIYIIIAVVGFTTCTLSIKKNNRFWNTCFILLVGLLIFNMIRGYFSYN